MTKANTFINRNMPRIITAIIIVILCCSVFFLMQHVQGLLASDVKINLTEVVTQNKDVIANKLRLEINNLNTASTQIVENLNQSVDGEGSLQSVFIDYSRAHEGARLFVANADGVATMSTGETVDVSGRKYYRIAMQGDTNISDKLIARTNGDETFIISVPLVDNGTIIGTLQRFYSPEDMYNLCSISLFSSQGYMYIINSDGYILISSQPSEYNRESENLYRFLYAQGNQEQSKQLEDGIKKNEAGFIETTIDGIKTFSAYTPLEDVHDWFLITSVPTSAVSPNANIVVEMFYIILFVVVLIFAIWMYYFFRYKNKQQAALQHIAFVDTVTQGNTYNKFSVDLQHILLKNPEKQFYLLIFDIDNFRYINAFYGFDYGDRILSKITQEVGEKLLPEEAFARISGDHFVALLTDVSQERLNGLLSLTQPEDGVMIYLSGGVYVITDPKESVNLMVDKATTAARTAKEKFHKTVEFYSEKFDQQMIHNEQLKRALEKALRENEIVPFYQPKVDVNTCKLVGAEALARWRKPDGRLMPPDEFIPMCEKTGLIVELDMAIFEQVLQFIRKNLDEGIACVPISVNFSRLHLLDKHFMDKLVEKVRKYDVPSELIEIELTESLIFDNHEMISDFIANLHQNGFLVSMDDFGSGYSSLNMLKDIPIDILKIDRAFLKETSNSERQRIIFASIARMAKMLDIQVVVEGVETIENVEMMKEYGCQAAQGYYFAKPMDERSFEKIYREGNL